MMVFTINPKTGKSLELHFPISWSMEDINFFLEDKPHLTLKDKAVSAVDVDNVDVIVSGNLKGDITMSDSALRQSIEDATVAVPAVPVDTVPNTLPDAIPAAPVPVAAPVAAVKSVHVKTGGIVERTCVECKAVFQYASKRGRPPVKCPACKSKDKAADSA